MGRGRGGREDSFRKSPMEPVAGGVRAVPRSPRERTMNHQSPCNAIDPGSVTYTAGSRPGECFSVRYVTFR